MTMAVSDIETQDMYDNAILDALKDKQVDVMVEPTENVHDKFAEQRKWIGKLCHFWNSTEYTDDEIGILENIVPTHKYSSELDYFVPYKDSCDCWYEHCEPVKPDDDIIYKGE